MTTANILLGWPNRIDEATLSSAGAWTLPLTNLQSREMSKVARSTGTAEAHTRVILAFAKLRTLRAFAIVNHNLSANASWRVTLGSTSGGSDIYDSDWMPVWSMNFDDVLEWESAVWWSGFGMDEYLRSSFSAMHVMPDFANAQYAQFFVRDTMNSDGYIQLGRLFAGNAIQPQYNASYGLQDRISDLSITDRADSGSLWPVELPKLRGVSCVFERLSEEEGSYLHELMRQAGTTREVLYAPYPMEPARNQQFGFLGRLSQMSPIDYPFFGVRSMPVQIEELI